MRAPKCCYLLGFGARMCGYDIIYYVLEPHNVDFPIYGAAVFPPPLSPTPLTGLRTSSSPWHSGGIAKLLDIYMCVYMQMYAYIHTQVSLSIYIYTFTYIYMYIYRYKYIYTHITHIHTYYKCICTSTYVYMGTSQIPCCPSQSQSTQVNESVC